MTSVLTLSAYPLKTVRLSCGRCERKARYVREELVIRAGRNTTLSVLRLRIAAGLDCKWAEQALGNPTVGIEQCEMHYPDLMR